MIVIHNLKIVTIDEEFIDDGIGSVEVQAVSHWSLSPRTQCPTRNARCRVGKSLMTKLAVSHNYVQLVITVLVDN